MAEKTINFIKLPDGETYRVGGCSGFNLFDTKISDHILEGEEALGWALQGTYVYKEGVAGSRTSYADFYNRCLEEKELGTATETVLGDSTITMYINVNGHKFYDIANKDVVDTWYNTYGIADFYGIDTENERIFLPRDKYFAVTGGVMGNGMTLGWTDGTSNFGTKANTGTTNKDIWSDNMYGTSVGSITTGGNTPATNASLGITTDSSKSGITLEPNENKYLYICVGNTKVESALSNVTEITTSENDTLPLFYNFYSKEDMTTTGAYVNASLGSWLSGNVYTTAYNELVNKIGTDNVKANTDTYTDYDFVVNQDNMSFRLPIYNGEGNVLDYDNYTVLPLSTATAMTYTVQINGAIVVDFTCYNTNPDLKSYLKINGVVMFNGSNNNATNYMNTKTGQYLVSKGDVVEYLANYNNVPSPYSEESIKFIPLKGSGNLYYKVANAVTNLELLNASEVANAVNTVVPNNSSLISGYALPSTKKISLATGASGVQYIAPANGWFGVRIIATSAGSSWGLISNSSIGTIQGLDLSRSGAVFRGLLPVKKGDVATVSFGSATFDDITFYYAEGEE